MSSAPSFLKIVEAFWRDFGLKAAGRAQLAILDIDGEKYTFERWLRDAFGVQDDAFQSLRYAFGTDPAAGGTSGGLKVQPPTILSINVPHGTDTFAKTFVLTVAANSHLNCDDLMNAPSGGQMASKIPATGHVQVSAPVSNQVHVVLSHLNAVAQVGTYNGRIRKAGVELAQLQLNVT